jgi:hypothetical protein
LKFILYFSEFYCIFYIFLKFIRISEIINENEKLKNPGAQCWATLWPMVSAYQLSPAGDTARGAAMARVPCALAERSPHAVRVGWHVGQWPGGAQTSDEVLPVSTGGLRGCAGQGEAVRGSPVRRGDGEAACSGGIRRRWLAASFGGSCSTRVGRGVRRGQWQRTKMAGGGSSP